MCPAGIGHAAKIMIIDGCGKTGQRHFHEVLCFVEMPLLLSKFGYQPRYAQEI